MSKLEAKTFVEYWMKHYKDATYQKISEEFGVSRQYVEQYSQKLRKLGVTLPKLERRGNNSQIFSQADVDELNRIIRETV